jgi:hypothetical protein
MDWEINTIRHGLHGEGYDWLFGVRWSKYDMGRG